MTISVPVNSRMMLSGAKFCYAKFLDQSSFERIQNPDAICGNRDPLINRTAPGRRKIQFTTFHDVTYPILQYLLPLVGVDIVDDTYTAGQSIDYYDIHVDKVGAIHKYTNCRIARFILRGQVGTMPVSAECTWIAEDEIEDPGATWNDGMVDNLFGFPGTNFYVDETQLNIDRFAFVIDNKLVQSWNSSFTVTDIGPGPRQTLLATSVPYTTDRKDYYWDYRDTTSGAVIDLTLTNGDDSISINFPKGVLNPESPSIEGALEEIRLPQTWEAHRQSSTPAFSIILSNS